jgi:hypothetical protein
MPIPNSGKTLRMQSKVGERQEAKSDSRRKAITPVRQLRDKSTARIFVDIPR